MGRAVALPVGLGIVLLATACGSGAPASGGAPSGGALSGDVLVSAAASLTDAFGDLEAAFEDRHPDVDVVLNLAGSSTLREQILDGAPVDVVATADTATMATVADAGAVAGDAAVFATNQLQIAVPAGNPAGIRVLDDFADEGRYLGLCAPEVPCGALARQALDAAGVTPSIDTEEPSVRALLAKVAARELDAAIMYATDVAAEAAVDGVDLPAAADVTATYPIAVLADAPNPAAATAFARLVRSPEGRALLAARGFGAP